MGGFGQLYSSDADPFPPLDIPYLAGFLAHYNIPVSICDADALDLTPEQCARQVSESCTGSGQSLVILRTAAPTLDWDLSVAATIKGGCANSRLAVYGPVVSHVLPRLQREPCLDYIVQGEPDETVFELVQGRPEHDVRGAVVRQGDQWVSNAQRPFLEELDRLPFPKWELLPYKRYTVPRSSTTADVSFLPMLTSRGCPYGCHYCPYPVGQGLRWRFRSPGNVVDEIEHLTKNLGIRYILFRDPMFSMRQERVISICQEIQKRGLSFRWKCETRPDCVSEKTLEAMAAAGCEGINFGVESADLKIQANSGRKPIAQQKIIDMVALCRRLGIKTFCFFIIGLPGDTIQTILETISFAIRLRPTWVQFTAASPFIGTPLRQWAITQGFATEDEYAYISSHVPTMGNENLTKEQVAALHRFAKFFERYLMNRGGILKDESRRGVVYRSGRAVADRVADLSARAIFAWGRNRFARQQPTVA
jgi:radical SAM superfamily enzyme YgiQ (UPF0313 family)